MPTPAPSQQAINRRMALAQALQQQAFQPMDMPNYPGAKASPWGGIAQIVNQVFGHLAERKANKEQQARDAQDTSARLETAHKVVDASLPPDAPPDLRQALAQGLASSDKLRNQAAMMQVGQFQKQADEARDQARQTALLTQKQEADAAQQEKDRLAQIQRLAISLSGQRAEGELERGARSRENELDRQSRELIAQMNNGPEATKYQPDNVNVDGKPATVLRDPQGNFYDANTRQRITGRITPYIAPPTPRARGEITPTAEAGLIQDLNKQWNKASEDVQALYRANTIMDSGIEAAKRGDMNAGSQAVLVTFQKFLDPTSVVRESEYARSAQGLAVAERLRGYVEKLQKGGAGMTLDELQKFAALGKEINMRLAGEGTSLLDAERKRITGIAGRYNIPPELAIPKYDMSQPAPKPASPKGSKGDPLGIR